MIRAVGYLLAEAMWSLVHRLFDKHATWDHADDDRTTADGIARWVGDHKHPPG